MRGLVQQRDVDQDIDLIEILLCLLGLLQGTLEVVQRFLDLTLVLREQHADIVVGEERLIVDFQSCLVAL